MAVWDLNVQRVKGDTPNDQATLGQLKGTPPPPPFPARDEDPGARALVHLSLSGAEAHLPGSRLLLGLPTHGPRFGGGRAGGYLFFFVF